MEFPTIHNLPCGAAGIQQVAFDLMNEDDDFYVPEALGSVATSMILESWSSVWLSAEPMLEQLLIDYKQGKPVAEMISERFNNVSVLVMPPEDEEKFRFELFIDAKTERGGSHIFGVEFIELSADSASATF